MRASAARRGCSARRPARRGALLLAGSWLCWGAPHLACSVVVSGEVDVVYCSDEGAIGAPACDPGFVCGDGRCVACVAVDACGDRLDNDCDGQTDEQCPEVDAESSAGGSVACAGRCPAMPSGGAAGVAGFASPD